MASLIGKAKKLRRESYYGEGEFKQIKVEGQVPSLALKTDPCLGIEITWYDGKVIRFAQVDLLIDFLKKAS